MVAYTGCDEAIDWLEANVASPVSNHWGAGAALLGTPWPRLVQWLRSDGPRRLMALDALLEYRAPAPDMAPLAQIAAPVLAQAPARNEFQQVLEELVRNPTTPRVRQAVERILPLADEILGRRVRGVAVADLPCLFVDPKAFVGANAILARHERVLSDVRGALQDVMDQHKPK